MVNYADMMGMIDSLYEQKIENLIMDGVIAGASEYNPDVDYANEYYADEYYQYV